VTEANAQLSNALAENVTCASQRPGSVLAIMVAGQTTNGRSWSSTIT
jgi:hypothetical protein